MKRDTRKQARRGPGAVRAVNSRRSSGQQTHAAPAHPAGLGEATLEHGEITAGLDVLLRETNGYDADVVVLVDDLRRVHLSRFSSL